ncbi:MAG: hypothetical protein ACYSVY_29775 [Planctomycetota bacterium]|jgi:hypothetical protein
MRYLRFILLPLVLVACTDQQLADPDLADGPLFNNGAVLFRGDFGCAVIDGEGNWFPENYLEPPDFPALFCGTEVATFSKNGNASLTVRASGVPNPTGKTVHWGPYNPGQDWADSYLPDITEPPYPCFVLGPDRDLDNPPLITRCSRCTGRRGSRPAVKPRFPASTARSGSSSGRRRKGLRNDLVGVAPGATIIPITVFSQGKGGSVGRSIDTCRRTPSWHP